MIRKLMNQKRLTDLNHIFYCKKLLNSKSSQISNESIEKIYSFTFKMADHFLTTSKVDSNKIKSIS